MMLAEQLQMAANDEPLSVRAAGLALMFNTCAAPWERNRIFRDFFSNQGPRFRPFFMKTIRHARAGLGRSAYPGLKGDK